MGYFVREGGKRSAPVVALYSAFYRWTLVSFCCCWNRLVVTFCQRLYFNPTEEITSHLISRDSPITFRQGVVSFSARGKFVKKSASACRVS